MSAGYWIILLMIIPIVAAIVAYAKTKTINIKESGVSVGVSLLLICIVIAIGSCTSQTDTETHSGHIFKLEHTPEWEAEWEELVTETHTDADGNSYTTSHYETCYETHYPTWTAISTVGSRSVSESYWLTMKNRHGINMKEGYRPDYDEGDKYDYWTNIPTNSYYPLYPVSITKTWTNKYKNTDSIVVGEPIEEEEAKQLGLPNYPSNNFLKSNRIIGSCNISTKQWDQLNAVVGQRDHVNLILVNMSGNSQQHAIDLKRYWMNGKKNDLVICYSNDVGAGKWSYVFGWSKSELIKQNLQTIFLDNKVDDTIIPLIDDEMAANFQPYNWEEVEVVTKGTPIWAIITAFILMLLAQIGLYYYFHHNEI